MGQNTEPSVDPLRLAVIPETLIQLAGLLEQLARLNRAVAATPGGGELRLRLQGAGQLPRHLLSPGRGLRGDKVRLCCRPNSTHRIDLPEQPIGQEIVELSGKDFQLRRVPEESFDVSEGQRGSGE